MGVVHFEVAMLVEHFRSTYSSTLFVFYIASVVVDIILGNTYAWVYNDVQSDVGLKGTIKHLAIASFVFFFLPTLSFFLKTDAVSTSVLGYLVYQYFISISENMGKLGFKLPKTLTKSLKSLHEPDDAEEQVEHLQSALDEAQKQLEEMRRTKK